MAEWFHESALASARDTQNAIHSIHKNVIKKTNFHYQNFTNNYSNRTICTRSYSHILLDQNVHTNAQFWISFASRHSSFPMFAGRRPAVKLDDMSFHALHFYRIIISSLAVKWTSAMRIQRNVYRVQVQHAFIHTHTHTIVRCNARWYYTMMESFNIHTHTRILVFSTTDDDRRGLFSTVDGRRLTFSTSTTTRRLHIIYTHNRLYGTGRQRAQRAGAAAWSGKCASWAHEANHWRQHKKPHVRIIKHDRHGGGSGGGNERALHLGAPTHRQIDSEWERDRECETIFYDVLVWRTGRRRQVCPSNSSCCPLSVGGG